MTPFPSSAGAGLEVWPLEVLYTVLGFASWRIRGSVFPLLSQQCLELSCQPSHFEFLARCLAAETLLFVPDVRGFVTRAVFMDMWKSRELFVGGMAEEAEEDADPGTVDEELAKKKGKPWQKEASNAKLSLTVCCRFRPSVSTAGGDDPANTKVVVPLHQRVKQVQISRGCTRKEALKIIMSSGHGQQKATVDAPAPDEDEYGDDRGREQQVGILQLDASATEATHGSGSVLAMVCPS